MLCMFANTMYVNESELRLRIQSHNTISMSSWATEPNSWWWKRMMSVRGSLYLFHILRVNLTQSLSHSLNSSFKIRTERNGNDGNRRYNRCQIFWNSWSSLMRLHQIFFNIKIAFYQTGRKILNMTVLW